MDRQGDNSISPRERFRRALGLPEMTPAELAEFRSQLADVRNQDEAKRASQQPDLLDKAA